MSKINFHLILLAAFSISLWGCTNARFTPLDAAAQNSLSSTSPTSDASLLNDQLIYTKMNKAVEFDASIKFDNGKSKRVALNHQGGTKIQTANGTLEVLDPVSMHMRYTPGLNFRGEDSALLYLMQGSSNVTQAQVRIQVESVIANLQPALAVRGSGCIMCHASLASSIITDFGYGDPYFFGGSTLAPTDHTSIYSDESTDPAWKYAIRLGPQVIVPYAPTSQLAKVGTPTLAAYLSGVISKSTLPAVSQSQVTEVSSVYIGAPTADRLRAVDVLT